MNKYNITVEGLAHPILIEVEGGILDAIFALYDQKNIHFGHITGIVKVKE